MSSHFFGGSVPELSPGYRFQWEEAQGCHVILYPEGMVKLSPSAGEILKRCDGTTSVDAVIADLQAAFPDTALMQDVYDFLEIAHEQGWIRPR